MRRLTAAAVLGAAALLSGCGVVLDAAGGTSTPAPASVSLAPGDRAALLARLGQPRPEDTGAHYQRKDWGDWDYDPATKCNTREDVLARDGEGEVVDEQCRPTCPTATCWTSRYDGVAAKDAADLQIDHIVPLAEANRSGARGWSAEQRAAFYNDRANLLAVSGKSNGSKGDSDPGRWRPDRAYWCDYATSYATVKANYGLHVDDAELAELTRMLGACG